MRPGDSQRPGRSGRRLLDELLHQLEASHWTRRDIFGVHLAVDEALVNAILHGNAMDEASTSTFAVGFRRKRFAWRSPTKGPGFDPDSLPNPTDPPHLDRPRGRGVMLMRAFMSRVEFHEPGNHVVLEKERRI